MAAGNITPRLTTSILHSLSDEDLNHLSSIEPGTTMEADIFRDTYYLEITEIRKLLDSRGDLESNPTTRKIDALAKRALTLSPQYLHGFRA